MAVGLVSKDLIFSWCNWLYLLCINDLHIRSSPSSGRISGRKGLKGEERFREIADSEKRHAN